MTVLEAAVKQARPPALLSPAAGYLPDAQQPLPSAYANGSFDGLGLGWGRAAGGSQARCARASRR